MSPKLLLLLHLGSGYGEFIPEKSDIFSLGISFLRIILLLSGINCYDLSNVIV